MIDFPWVHKRKDMKIKVALTILSQGLLISNQNTNKKNWLRFVAALTDFDW